MCFSIVEKTHEVPQHRPRTRVRWKIIQYPPRRTDVFNHYLGLSRTEVWVEATPKGTRTDAEILKGIGKAERDPNSGWHVYLSHRDAEEALSYRASRLGKVVTRVEVAGLLAEGRGDGYGNPVRVETYHWIRVPRGKAERKAKKKAAKVVRRKR